MNAIRCISEKDSLKTLQNMKIAINLFSYYYYYQILKQYTYKNFDTLLNDIKIFVTLNWLTKLGYLYSRLT